MRVILFLVFFFSYCNAALTQYNTNPTDTTVYLLTCSPGEELYSVFGHSAILVKTPTSDWVYNYGTFDFNTDNFYLKFARGQLPYQCTKEKLGYFQYAYLHEGRQIVGHALDLNSAQQTKLIDLLEENVLPENAEYKYDFFYDNCATRLRDIINKATDNRINWHLNPHGNGSTFRDMIDVYLTKMDWSDLGIDIALGMPCDSPVKAGEQDFLPDSLLALFKQGTLNGKSLVSDEIEIIPREDISASGSFWNHTTPVIGIFSAIIFSFLFVLRKKTAGRSIANVLLIINGLIGALIFFLWFLTDHNATANNLNLLWANPLNLILPFMSKLKKIWLKIYALGVLLLLITWAFLPQNMHESLLPLIALFLLASLLAGRLNN